MPNRKKRADSLLFSNRRILASPLRVLERKFGYPKLSLEFIPGGANGRNLHTALTRSEWNSLRKQVFEQANWRCQICGSKERLNCHEIWYAQIRRPIQTLVGLQSLCDLCHRTKHFGQAGWVDGYKYKKEFAHLCAQNGWGRAKARRYLDARHQFGKVYGSKFLSV
jgi:hypothetical protein